MSENQTGSVESVRAVKQDITAGPVNPPPLFEIEDNSPLEYFRRYFDSELIKQIVNETNLYSVQQTTKSVNTNVSEMEQFIGVLIYMGIVVMPSYVDYWAQSSRCEKITNIFSLKRFQKLRRYLHFTNNENAVNSNDRLFKIRPVLDAIVGKCRNIQQQESSVP